MVIVLLVMAYLVAFWLSIGSYAISAWWVPNIYHYKDYIATSIDQPKIIIAAGSSALFGIDGSTIEETTGYRVANLAVHGALDIDFLYYKLVEHLKKGDIIVMPIEFGVYRRGLESEWFTNNMISWGYEDYIKKLPLQDALSFVFYTPKGRVYQGALSSITQNVHNQHKNIPSLSQAEVVSDVEEILNSQEGGSYQGYNYKSLNKYGEFSVDEKPTETLLKKYKNGISYIPRSINSHFIAVFKKINKLAEARKATLILTWPITIRNKKYDLSTEKHQRDAKKFEALLSEQSIDIHCNPAMFSLGIEYFFDTKNHPNKNGALLISKNLSACINSMINNGTYHNLDFEKSVRIVDQLQAGFER